MTMVEQSMPVTVPSTFTVWTMLGQVSKPPAFAVSGNRVATVCRSVPMHANLEHEREAKVWQLFKTGNIANLKLQTIVVAFPKPTQVTVAVKAVNFALQLPSMFHRASPNVACMLQVGINFADVFTCLGLYQAAPKEMVVPGLEVGHLLLILDRQSWLPSLVVSVCLIMLHITQLCQFAGVVTEVADTAVDSMPQSANMASDSSKDEVAPQLQVGDCVLGACRFGSYATCLNVPAQQVRLTAHPPNTLAP